MAHEILSVKLCQLDDRVGKLHTRIRMSETASPSQLKQEINMLKQECREGEMSLHDTLKRSKSTMVSILAGSYEQMEQIIQNTKEQLQANAESSPDPDACAEEKILLAEYALDFAQQAADRALLLSMEAIDAQRNEEDCPNDTVQAPHSIQKERNPYERS